MIKAVLFDLDGTLLPMNQEDFIKAYFKTITKKLYDYGYDPELLIKNIWMGTNKMISNDGNKRNEEVFMDYFISIYGEKIKEDMKIFDDYYLNEFNLVKNSCGFNSMAKEVISILKKSGCKLILATNPIFPLVATKARIKWAGLDYKDFSLITSYENSKHSKPNLEYYKDITKAMDLNPSECIMIGNDVSEDMIASEIGMQTFLLTDCLINKNNSDITKYKSGNYDDLIKYLNEKVVN